MSVTLNATAIAQPQTVREWHQQIKHRNVSINGSLQENRIGQKKQAHCTWEMLTNAEYQQLLAILTSGAAVSYSNTTSAVSGGTFAFTALHDFEEGEYIRGASLLKPLSVTFSEV